MRLFADKHAHDIGFTPNPFHGVCTLATCKPRIRPCQPYQGEAGFHQSPTGCGMIDDGVDPCDWRPGSVGSHSRPNAMANQLLPTPIAPLILFGILLGLAGHVAGEDLPIIGTGTPKLVKIDALVLRLMKENGATAAQFSCMENGQFIYRKAFGHLDRARTQPMRLQSCMRIGSVSKPLTAAMVRDLIARNIISPDTKPFRMWTAKGELTISDQRLLAITVAMLLDHRGGWDREQTFDPAYELPGQPFLSPAFLSMTPQSLVRQMAMKPLQFTPGERTCYSNFGYIVLGRLIEQVTGKPYREYLHHFMTREIRSTEFDVSQMTPNAALSEPIYQTETCNIAAQDAAGGTMASASALCQFMNVFLVSGERFQGGTWTWTFFGSIPGACSMVHQRIDRTHRSFACILNARKNPLDRIPDEVDSILNGK